MDGSTGPQLTLVSHFWLRESCWRQQWLHSGKTASAGGQKGSEGQTCEWADMFSTSMGRQSSSAGKTLSLVGGGGVVARKTVGLGEGHTTHVLGWRCGTVWCLTTASHRQRFMTGAATKSAEEEEKMHNTLKSIFLFFSTVVQLLRNSQYV